MKQRHLLKVFLLTLVTLGIYHLYWLYATRKELLSRGSPAIPRLIVLFIAPLVMIGASLLYALVMSFRGDANADVAGVILSVALVLSVIAWPIICLWWMWRYAVAVESVTKQHMSRDFTFWTWLLLVLFGSPIIWLLLLQNEFNHLPGQKHTSSAKA